jgi:hypothetical protein
MGGEFQQRKASQGSFAISGDCDGVTRWEVETVAEDQRFVGGPAEGSAGALFTADGTSEEVQGGPVSATVHLRGQPPAR